MTLPSQSEIDIIATKILLDAKQAITDLRAWQITAKEAGKETEYFKKIVTATAKQMNGDFKAAAAAVQQFAKALNVNPQFIKKIGKDLQILDAIAQKSLGGVSQKTAESSARMTMLSSAIQTMATRGKISIDQVVSSLRALNASTDTKMGKLGFSDRSIVEAGNIARKTAEETRKVGTAGEQAGRQTESGFKRALTAVNALRIALGVLVSMLIFQVLSSIQNVFRTAIEQATKFEDTLYRLSNAEKALSLEGIEISLKGLKQGISDIQKMFPIFSKEDIASLVGTLAVSTKQLGLNEQQILNLAKAIAVLNIRSEKQEDIQTTAQHVLSSLLTGNARGITQLGIAFTDNVMRAKAMELGFLEADDALSELSENEKGLTKLAILMDSTNQEMESVGEYLDTNSAKIQANKAAWNDLMTTLGQIITPMIPTLTVALAMLNDVLQVVKVAVVELGVRISALKAVMDAFSSGQIKNLTDLANVLKTSMDEARTIWTNKMFEDVPENAPDWFMRGWGNRIKEDAETATNALGDMYAAAAEDEDAEKALQDIDEKIQDIILDAKQAQEDLDLKLQQKQDDLDLEYQRKYEDAARNHAQKLRDINLDAQQKAEDAKRKAREDERKAEEDLLQKLKELREKYLLDLEEALHARDARQVLRLMKEYKLEKQNILDRAKLDEGQRKRDLAADLAAIELERQRRIQNENIEYQRKLADLATAKAREQEELRLWYQREQEDIQRNVEQKLQKLLAGYIAEGKIHETEQAKIYAILAKYFAADMALVDRMAQFMAVRFAQMSQMAATFNPAPVGSLNYQLGLPDKSNPFTGQYKDPLPKSKNSSPYWASEKMAEGGTIVANRPTTVQFGEAGLEAATFTPLDRSGRDVGKLFGDVAPQGANGQIYVEVDLSPDLEARVVRRSMDSVAGVVSRVNNRKVK